MLERLPLLNNTLTRLQYFTEQAYTRKDVFVQSMLHASHLASQVNIKFVNYRCLFLFFFTLFPPERYFESEYFFYIVRITCHFSLLCTHTSNSVCSS